VDAEGGDRDREVAPTIRNVGDGGRAGAHRQSGAGTTGGGEGKRRGESRLNSRIVTLEPFPRVGVSPVILPDLTRGSLDSPLR
jgi:hypothetical protein